MRRSLAIGAFDRFAQQVHRRAAAVPSARTHVSLYRSIDYEDFTSGRRRLAIVGFARGTDAELALATQDDAEFTLSFGFLAFSATAQARLTAAAAREYGPLADRTHVTGQFDFVEQIRVGAEYWVCVTPSDPFDDGVVPVYMVATAAQFFVSVARELRLGRRAAARAPRQPIQVTRGRVCESCGHRLSIVAISCVCGWKDPDYDVVGPRREEARFPDDVSDT